MKAFAVRKDDLWFDASGYESFEPLWINDEAKAQLLASQKDGVVEVYETTKVHEYSVSRMPHMCVGGR